MRDDKLGNDLSDQVRSALGADARQRPSLQPGDWGEHHDAQYGQTLIGAQRAKARGAEWTVETMWSTTGPRLEPVEVTIRSVDGHPVVADHIRAIPLGTMQREARNQAAGLAATWSKATSDSPAMRGLLPGFERPAANAGGAQRGATLTADDIAMVAAVYNQARSAGLPVTDAVAAYFTISRSAASKRIMKARASDLLDGQEEAR